MARYRRYYRRYVRAAKKKWASNTVELRISSGTIAAESFDGIGQIICQNGDRVAQSATSIKSSAQILKTTRFRFRGVISNNGNSYLSLLYYIAYVPEGASALFVGTAALTDLGNYGFYSHPEWVMAWGRKDYTNSAQNNEISLTTKLKRNLNSGDSIYFIACWINNSASQVTAYPISGTVSYMCCAN